MAEKILIVDDEPDIRELIGEILIDEGYQTRLAANAEQARAQKTEYAPDLILLDVWMPDSDGISLLKEWRGLDQLDCPVVMISGHGSVETAVEATRNGAVDFIEKPVSMARLLITIKNALAQNRTKPDPGHSDANASDVLDPIGRSPAIEYMREQAEQIAALTANVLIIGEPGSGRTTLAHWLHHHSAQTNGPMLHISSGSELEQHAQTITASQNDSVGTLLIDPLEWLHSNRNSVNSQAQQILQLLAARPRWRVIATALPGIEQTVRDNHFDTGLFHRIDELQLKVPALRDRREDIPELVRHFAERIPAREDLPYRHFPVPVQNRLRQHDWPGNLRELFNLVQQLLLEGQDDEVRLDEVEAQLRQPRIQDHGAMASMHSPLFELPLREARETFERQYLTARLRQVGGSVGQLADAVEMERTHLYRKLRQLGIDPKQLQEEN